jgi:hypothetical protein
LYHHTAKLEQIVACLLAEMNAMEERMEAKIEANNEKFEALQGPLVSWMDILQDRTEAMQEKNGRQPIGNESRPRTPERRNEI